MNFLMMNRTSLTIGELILETLYLKMLEVI